MPTVVYTAITGGKDSLKSEQNAKDVKYIAFVENPADYSSDLWELRNLYDYLPKEYRSLDPNRKAKWFKLHPHKLFGKEFDKSVWVDGSVVIQKDLAELVQNIKRWGVFKHFQRDCILEEMYVCSQLNLDDPILMRKQVAHYIKNCGYPVHNGLAENTVIVRNHNDKRVKALCSRWWQEILMWSKRDQLSFDYCSRIANLRYEVIPGNVYQNEWFKVYTHAY